MQGQSFSTKDKRFIDTIHPLARVCNLKCFNMLTTIPKGQKNLLIKIPQYQIVVKIRLFWNNSYGYLAKVHLIYIMSKKNSKKSQVFRRRFYPPRFATWSLQTRKYHLNTPNCKTALRQKLFRKTTSFCVARASDHTKRTTNSAQKKCRKTPMKSSFLYSK